MISVILEDGELRPYLLCANCCTLITKEKPGVLSWGVDLEGEKYCPGNNGYFVHKGECHDLYESKILADGKMPNWIEIRDAMRYLGINSTT